MKLIEDDDLGLLTVKPRATGAQNEDESLSASSEEILAFVDAHKKEPEENYVDLNEHRLYSRLKGIRNSQPKIDMLRSIDQHNLLKEAGKFTSIDDIINDDDLGILKSSEIDIFTVRNLPERINKVDYIGKTKPCNDFGEFEPLFLQCQTDLKAGKRKLRAFRNDSSIKLNRFYVRNGVLLYVAEMHDRETRKEQNRGRVDYRLRCIYKNGTEWNILRNTLAKRLRENGRRVTEHGDNMLAVEPEEEDQEAGFIYVLQSLSDNPEISNLENLYKIGFSRIPVEERVKNAENDTTFLRAPVKIIATYQCYNMNTQKCELLLHRFLGEACLEVDVFDENNKRHTPREWFVVPLEVVEETIGLIVSGEIVNFFYNAQTGTIVPKA